MEDLKKELVTKEDSNLIDNSIAPLTKMIIDAVEYQKEVSPIYQKIHNKILEIFSKEEELDNLEVKELIKLLDLTAKAQLQPVDQLTKLVQAVAALYDRSELEAKTKALDILIKQFEDHSTKPVLINEEDVEIQEATFQTLEDLTL